LQEQSKQARFERSTLAHLDAAYNLARWLIGNEQDAEDMVQEAYLRAFKFFDTFHGVDSRAWLLAIVRNTCYTWLRQQKSSSLAMPYDDELHDDGSEMLNPERLFIQNADNEALRTALAGLPVEFREVIILRDLEDMSYKEIAGIVAVPLGTVMSRLSRARKRLQQSLMQRAQGAEY
jgi:RNA polymerase sigma-70 factor (ECF subfamily)